MGNSNDSHFLSILQILIFRDAERDLIESFTVCSPRTFHELSSHDLIVKGDGQE